MTVPQELASEDVVLSLMLQTPADCLTALKALSADHFSSNIDALVFAKIATMVEHEIPVDQISVEQSIRDQLRPYGGSAVIVNRLFNIADPWMSIGYHIDKVREMATRRQSLAASQRFTQRVTEGVPVGECMAELTTTLDYIRTDHSAEVPGLYTGYDWLDQEDESEDWVIPSLIAPSDVMMLLAQSGHGKSVLSRQMVTCLAAGIHPFIPRARIKPRSVLLVDLENSKRDLREGLRLLRAQMGNLVDDLTGDRFHLLHRPEGLNLRTPQGAEDLEHVVAETAPALVCIGPLYKAAPKGRDDYDTAADEARAVFDRIRARHNCGLFIEHHMSRQSAQSGQSPYGSTIWERWPSHGRVLRDIDGTHYELAMPFRADRSYREWPVGLHRGGELPWLPIEQGDMDWHMERAKGSRSSNGRNGS